MANPPQTPRVVRFGVFEVDLQNRELRKSGVKIKLHDQPFQVLSSLLERPGEIVLREELRQRLWPAETFVDFDHGLNTAVNRLRDALSDSADSPRFIETLPRRGYRFIAPLSAEPARSVAPVRWPAVLWVAAVVVIAGLGLWLRSSTSANIESPFRPVPLTSYPGYESFPSISPDATRVAFSWTGDEAGRPSIYIKLIGPGEPVRLTANPAGDFSPAWSADGRYIAFLRVRDNNHAAIVIVPAMGGHERELTTLAFESGNILGHWTRLRPPPYITWSANGKWLLALDGSQVVRVSMETGEKTALTFPALPETAAWRYRRMEPRWRLHEQAVWLRMTSILSRCQKNSRQTADPGRSLLITPKLADFPGCRMGAT